MTGVANPVVVAAFTYAGDSIVATIESVAPFAIGIFLAVMGFKYGKKIFNIVAGDGIDEDSREYYEYSQRH